MCRVRWFLTCEIHLYSFRDEICFSVNDKKITKIFIEYFQPEILNSFIKNNYNYNLIGIMLFIVFNSDDIQTSIKNIKYL